jgi:hypothetical protein
MAGFQPAVNVGAKHLHLRSFTRGMSRWDSCEKNGGERAWLSNLTLPCLTLGFVSVALFSLLSLFVLRASLNPRVFLRLQTLKAKTAARMLPRRPFVFRKDATRDSGAGCGVTSDSRY